MGAIISEWRFNTSQEIRAIGKRLQFRFRFAGFFLLALLAAAPVGASNPTPVGVWLHANGRIEVEIAPCGDRLCGKLVWFKWPNDAQGRPLVDLKNPAPKLRKRPLLGLTILTGLRSAGDGTWEDGTIYNPDDGITYEALMSFAGDGNLRVRAYVMFPFLGETQIWTRVR
jgi:uncharacterized protein (DUF2147 family)